MQGGGSGSSEAGSRASTSSRGRSSRAADPRRRDIKYQYQELVDVSKCELVSGSPAMMRKSKEDPAAWNGLVNTMSVAKALGGYIPVTYYLLESQEGWGRMRAEVMVDGLSAVPYVYMQRAVRGHLAARNYWDVDMVNCQPTILQQRLDLLDIPCPLLSRYVADREGCLEDVQKACGVSRDAAKKLFLRLVYLGSPQKWAEEQGCEVYNIPAWICDFRDELNECAKALVEHPENIKLRKYYSQHAASTAATNPIVKSNPIATMLALYLQTEERKCVIALVEAISVDRRVGGIIHDGVHVAKSEVEMSTETTIPVVQLKRWRQLIMKETGITMQLSVKPFDCDPEWLRQDDSRGTGEQQPDSSFLDGHILLSYPEMKARWEERSFKVVEGSMYVREKRNRRVTMNEKSLQESYKHLHFISVSVPGDGSIDVKKKPFIPAWLLDPIIRKYECLVSMPPPLVAPAGAYNIWDGFAVERYEPGVREVSTDSDGVRQILSFLDVLCNRDREVTDYLLDWMAHPFQHPSVKNQVAIVLRGEQGVGKNRTTDLLSLMLGEDKTLNTSTPSTTLYGTYTNLREGKFLIVVNEAHGSDNIANNEKLKDIITSSTFVSNAKYLNAYTMSCYARMMFTTNNDNCLKLESGDRRFLVIDVSSELKGDGDYFKRLSACIEDEHVRFEFYRFLMSRDLTGRRWDRDRPIRGAYTDMMAVNLEYEYQFIRDLVLRHQGTVLERQADRLYDDFRMWLIQKGPTHGNHNTSAIKFGQKLSKLIAQGARATTGFTAITKRRAPAGNIYTIDVPAFRQEMLAKHWCTPDD
jgi:hypothetical protein